MYGLEYGYKFLYAGTSGTQTPHTATMTGAGSVSLTLQINKVFAPAGVGTSTLVKDTSKSLAFTGTGTNVLTYTKNILVSATMSGIGTVTAVSSKVAYVTATITGIGSSVLDWQANKVFNYTGTGTAVSSTTINRLVSAVMSGVGTASTTVKDVAKSITFSGTGTSVVEATKVILKSLSFTGTGSSAMTYTKNILQNLSFSGVGSSSLIKAISTSYTIAATGTPAVVKDTTKNSFNSTGRGTVTEFDASLTLIEQFANMVGIGAGTLVRQINKIFSPSGTGTPDLLKKDTSKNIDLSVTGTQVGDQDFNTSQDANMTGIGTLATITQFFTPSGFSRIVRRAWNTFLRRR